jgi:hypothetical protein
MRRGKPLASRGTARFVHDGIQRLAAFWSSEQRFKRPTSDNGIVR